jgi:hypothetical protein
MNLLHGQFTMKAFNDTGWEGQVRLPEAVIVRLPNNRLSSTTTVILIIEDYLLDRRGCESLRCYGLITGYGSAITTVTWTSVF